MTELRHGTYVGPDKLLSSKTALVRLTPRGALAQFDSYNLGHFAFGWHAFRAEDFEIEEPCEEN